MSNSNSNILNNYSIDSSRHSNFSIPPIIRINSFSEANLSSISSGISREKRSIHGINYNHRFQNNNKINHFSFERGKFQRQYHFHKTKASVSHHRREVIIKNFSKFCIFEFTQLHCREHIHKR